MRLMFVRAMFAICCALFALPSLHADVVDVIRDRAMLAKLRAAKAGETIRIEGVPVGADAPGTIELRPVKVWADDARIVVYGDHGIERVENPPATRYFRGRVAGASDSGVSVALYPDGRMEGLILHGDSRLILGSGRPVRDKVLDREIADAPILVSAISAIDEITEAGAGWECQSDARPELDARLQEPGTNRTFEPRTDGNSGWGVAYTMTLAFETDAELSAAFGGNVTMITDYMSSLVVNLNLIYERDLNATVLMGHLNVRTGAIGSDPWTVLPGGSSAAFDALLQFGTYWHNNHPFVDTTGKVDVQRAAAIFVSGKNFGAGAAWPNAIGDPDFADGADFGGAYAFLGTSGSITTGVPDPTLTRLGVEYGLGLSSSNSFWMLLQFAHELGHLMNGRHTHCVSLSPAERAAYGVPSTRTFIDLCDASEGSRGCFGGTTSVPAEYGTVMSHCHDDFVSGVRQSRYIMGVPGQPSEKMLNFLNIGLELGAPDARIVIEEEPVACSAGRSASVATCTNCTYAWTIKGGTINGPTTGSVISFTPADAGTTLTVTVTNPTNRMTVTAPRQFFTSCPSIFPAPTNLVATATAPTSVHVTWNAVPGATQYHVSRSSTVGSSFGIQDTTLLSWTDTTVAANSAYVYSVSASDGAFSVSPSSNHDVAVTVTYTDPVLTTATTAKRAHVDELMASVNLVRVYSGQAPVTFDAPAPVAGGAILKAHLDKLRGELTAVQIRLGLATASFTDPTITPGSTTIKREHITQLRGAMQ